MAKVTLGKLYALGQMGTLTALVSEQRGNLPAKTGYWVGRMLRKLQTNLEVIEQERQKVLRENSPEGQEPGKPLPPENSLVADAAFGAFLAVEVEFDFLPLARTELAGCRVVTEGQLMTLEDAGLLIDEPAATV